MPEQKQFDFTIFGHRASRLKAVQLPKMSKTTPTAMKAVLRVLNDHAREKATCYPRVEVIARDMNCSRAKVDRAIAALKELRLLDVKPTGRYSVYRIIWSNLADYVPSAGDAMPKQSRHDDNSDSAPCQSSFSTMPKQSRHGAKPKEAPKETNKEPPPQTNAGWEEVERILRNEFAIGDATKCVAAFRRRGESLPDATRIFDEYRDGMRAERWDGPGALWWQFQNGAWPDESQHAATEKRRDQAAIQERKLQASLAATATGKPRPPSEQRVGDVGILDEWHKRRPR